MTALNPAETEVTLLLAAMIEIFGDHAERVQKRMLGKLEPDAMLGPINPVFRSIPFEIGHRFEPCYDMYNVPYLCMD